MEKYLIEYLQKIAEINLPNVKWNKEFINSDRFMDIGGFDKIRPTIEPTLDGFIKYLYEKELQKLLEDTPPHSGVI